MDYRLNGFCTDFPVQPKKELLIPDFVNEDHDRKKARQWRANIEEAQMGAVAGTAKKQARQFARAERSQKECILFLVGVALMFLFVGAIG